MRYQINSTGNVIEADHDFVEANFHGDYTLLPDLVVTPPTPVVRRLSKLAYMNRFTDEELAGIYTAAKSVVQVEVWLAKFNAATPDADGTSVDLDDPRTIAGLQAMEAAGLLSAGRAAEILS